MNENMKARMDETRAVEQGQCATEASGMDVTDNILHRLQRKRNQLNAQLQLITQQINLLIEYPVLVKAIEFEDSYNMLQRVEHEYVRSIQHDRNRKW